ncbi:MAG TPA: hypothetical protein VK068_03645, partial [Jeotgalicoccus sp.]|nr:hypothetical protein [Jeotgalicoccus sp.]
MRINSVETSYSYILINNELSANSIDLADSINLGDFTLFHSKDMDINKYSNGEIQLVVLGYMLDIRNGELSTKEILEKLFNSSDLDRTLDYINGRYVLLFKSESDFFVYTDASALLPINYNDDKSIVASHDILIKELLNDNNLEVKPLRQELKGSFDFTRF